jgi:hypothetical protein
MGDQRLGRYMKDSCIEVAQDEGRVSVKGKRRVSQQRGQQECVRPSDVIRCLLQ